MKKQRATKVHQPDLWYMLLGYVRYAMGRMSSAPSLARDLVRSYGPACNDVQLEQIRREVAEELASYEMSNKTLGWECDHATWKGVVADIEAQQRARQT